MIHTQVISAFPGTGKSYLYEKLKEKMVVLDSDSSKFSWIEEGVRHPDFPNNYIEHIKANISLADIIFISSHDVVRSALNQHGIHYTLIYPKEHLKNEYLDRYQERGNNEGFINMIDRNWYLFMEELKKETFPNKIELESGQFIGDVIRIQGVDIATGSDYSSIGRSTHEKL